jgi:ubiquinone/menaquinone biosynthesis C-methylase UbiE
MRSRFVDDFDHTRQAAKYDKDVTNEENPVRTGYESLLSFIANRVNPQSRVLELGCGTGNLTLKLKEMKEIIGVDISDAMIAIAKTKIEDNNVHYCQDDILSFFDYNERKYDYVISSYTCHHLTESEKKILFKKSYNVLDKPGVALFGDLMFENNNEKKILIKQFKQRNIGWLIDIMKKEFYWNIETSVKELGKLGFQCKTYRFSDLSWVIEAIK